MTANITDELCKVCDGRIECAPTAILLISLVHTLYGTLSPEPNYFGHKKGLNDPLRYKPETYNLEDKDSEAEEFDFIVVGGGTAGCVIASRLSENKNWKVLLVEAGPEEPKMALIPGLTSEFRGSSLDWQYSMRPKRGFCQNRAEQGCEVVQGRVLGGTSAINDLAYIRGSQADYDDWALDGNEGWTYGHVLPFFKYSEGNFDKDITKNSFYHSTQGPLDVGRYPYVDDNVDILLSALNELGYNYTDINGRSQLGFMRVQAMSYFGERVSTYRAYIEPIRKTRSNLHIVTGALVVKINMVSSADVTVSGITYLINGTRIKVNAKKEVIVSAGAINTPKLLMLSGLGPKDYLEYLSIPIYSDLPVGSNFQDHLSVCLPVITLTKTSTTVKFPHKLKDISDYYTKNSGPLSANFQVIAFLETKLSDILNTADIEVRFKGHDSNMYYERIDMCITLLTPKSRGQVVLNSTDPIFGKPLIYPSFLKDPMDEKKLLDGIQQIVKIFDTEAFKNAGYEFDPRAILKNECREYEKVSEQLWSCIIKYFSEPLHNYAGTCKMGVLKDPSSVVDNNLRVYGVNNLRVADASIMPKITRGSTAAPVIMIAEMASDKIKTTWYYSIILFYMCIFIIS